MLAGQELYETARRIDHATALNMIREADNEEERNFWAYIADMNLQRAQRAALLVQQVSGNMALSGMELTEEDKERIRYIVEHPDKTDEVLQALIEKHTKTPEK